MPQYRESNFSPPLRIFEQFGLASHSCQAEITKFRNINFLNEPPSRLPYYIQANRHKEENMATLTVALLFL